MSDAKPVVKRKFSQPPNLDNLTKNPDIEKFLNSGEASEKPALVEKAPPAKKTTSPKKTVVKVDEKHTWMLPTAGARTQHIVRIPLQLKLLLEFLAETTYGETMTSIGVRGLTKEVEAIAKKEGLPLPKDWGEWLESKS